MKKLYLVTITYDYKSYEFYVIAEHETEASEKAQKEYDSYKYFTAKVTKIELIAENKQYSCTNKILLL